MRRTLMMTGAAAAAVLLGTGVFAAAWNVPNNVRVVQKSNTDTTGRIYGTVQAAINSITNASASNRYVVRIMPGIYNEVVTLKPYVELVGSSRENTVITSAVNNVDFDTCTNGTVLMANNSAIRNLKVVNNAPDGGSMNLAAAVVLNNVAAEIENVNILVGSDSMYGGRNNGVCAVGVPFLAT